MKTAFVVLTALLAWTFLPQSTALGHGGQYGGPSDQVPPNLGQGPGDRTPGQNPGGPVTIGPTGPTQKGPGGVVTTGIGPGAGYRGPGGGTTKKPTRATSGYDRWEFWWELNKDRFLNLKNRLGRMGNFYGASSFLSGRGRKENAFNPNRPTIEMIKAEILPSLLNVLEVDQAEILDSAALALARTTRPEDADLVLKQITGLLGSSHNSVQQSATLSLGVLGSAEAIRPLYNLMIDSKEGRKLTGRHEVPHIVRAFAALSLGIINNPDCVPYLIRVIEREPDRNRELRVCAVTALGLMRDNARMEDIVQFLVRLLPDNKLDPFVRASVPVALGKLGDPIALGMVIKAFKSNDIDPLFRQSLAIAMGQLSDLRRDDCIKALTRYVQKGKDIQTRHFALIALGQIAAQFRGGDEEAEQLNKIHKFLMMEIRKPNGLSHRPWAALGAAIHARKNTSYQPYVVDLLIDRFERNRDPSHRSALAVALGLLNAKRHAPLLKRTLEKSGDNLFSGYLCIALGLMNDSSAMDTVRNILADGTSPYRLRLQAATTLGLMGDTQAVDLLVRALKDGQTLSVISSAVKALGLIGDRHAIAPLQELLNDEGAQDLSRAFAAVALGIIGEKTDLPWNSMIAQNSNYRAKTEAIAEVLDIL